MILLKQQRLKINSYRFPSFLGAVSFECAADRLLYVSIQISDSCVYVYSWCWCCYLLGGGRRSSLLDELLLLDVVGFGHKLASIFGSVHGGCQGGGDKGTAQHQRQHGSRGLSAHHLSRRGERVVRWETSWFVGEGVVGSIGEGEMVGWWEVWVEGVG